MNKFPSYIEVNSPLEFTRLVCALERSTRVSFLHEYKGKKVLAVQMDLLKESPVIYYAPVEKLGHFLSYGFKSGKEESLMVDSTLDNSKIYSPIVKIKSLPKSLQGSPNSNIGKYQPLECEDLGSLAKLSYGFEEAPFPLFSFPLKEKWLVGVFLNFNEDGDSYFCYVSLNEEPNKPFLKYTTTNGTEPIFVDNTSEHGYSYIKIVKLHDTHPLVDYDQIQN
ncbi:MAG: hypothetical protein VYC06_02115 [Thermoproteota archaeon]|nr:hypothetical protein [Thermoproteota archaeon]